MHACELLIGACNPNAASDLHLQAGSLVDTLNGPGPFTVFAPTNKAFAALPTGVLANLLKPENKAQLDAILTYHVVPGKYNAKDLKDGETLKTVEGNSLTVRTIGTTFLINRCGGTRDLPSSFSAVLAALSYVCARIYIPPPPYRVISR